MEKHFKDRKTKIVCTLGPSSNTLEMIEKMAEHGVDIARLNFSHGTYEDHLKVIEYIKEVNKKREVPIGILLDTKGPEIRTGKFKEPVVLEAGAKVTLTTEEIEWCSKDLIYINSIIATELIKITENTSVLARQKPVPQSCLDEHAKLEQIIVEMCKKYFITDSDNIKSLKKHILKHE